MGIEDAIFRLDSYESRSAGLFHDTVKQILTGAGFIFMPSKFLLVRGEMVKVGSGSERLAHLVKDPDNFTNVNFLESFARVYDFSLVGAFSMFKNLDEFKSKVFNKYAISSASALGSPLRIVERESVFDRRGNYFAAKDFREGAITRVASHYYFTLNSLLKTLEGSPSYNPSQYKC